MTMEYAPSVFGPAQKALGRSSIAGVIQKFPGFVEEWLGAIAQLNGLLLGAAALLFLFAVLSLMYSVLSLGLYNLERARYWLRIFFQSLGHWIFGFILIFSILGLVPIIHDATNAALDKLVSLWRGPLGDKYASGVLSVLSTLAGGVLSYWKYKSAQQNSGKGALDGFGAWAAAGFLLFGILILAYALAEHISNQYNSLHWVILAFAFFFGTVVNLNQASLHRMYRDRLMEAFLPDVPVDENLHWRRAKQSNKAKLCEIKNKNPYLIINTNVILTDSENRKYRDRGGDNFILTPLYCGSAATTWRLTEKFIGGDMTLSTAMAVSGAALNPNAGVGGQGITRSGVVSALLTILNLRLGYWVRNPLAWDGIKSIRPNYIVPILWTWISSQFHEKAAFLELSDGGHFENTGIYELIRRRVKLIVVADASADPKFSFEDLGVAIERVRADFDAEIVFSEPGCDLKYLLPGSGENKDTAPGAVPPLPSLIKKDAFQAKYDLAEKGFAVGWVVYNASKPQSEREYGTIYYLKPTIVRGLPVDVYAYRAMNSDFPHQTTADQFFDEAQFEAYRVLGKNIAGAAIKYVPSVAPPPEPFWSSPASSPRPSPRLERV